MKKVNKQIDSSSSEDEIPANILKEAIDEQFLNDNLYTTRKTTTDSQSGLETKKLNRKSLRESSKQKDQFTNFGVSATLQSFIAKKLDEILERTIELKSNEIIEHNIKQEQKKNKKYGIKLLSTSKKFLTVTEPTEIYVKHEKKSKKCKKNKQIAKDNDIEDSDDLSKFQEAAIDPEHILNYSYTKASWCSKYSEPEFKYKKSKDGTLIEKI